MINNGSDVEQEEHFTVSHPVTTMEGVSVEQQESFFPLFHLSSYHFTFYLHEVSDLLRRKADSGLKKFGIRFLKRRTGSKELDHPSLKGSLEIVHHNLPPWEEEQLSPQQSQVIPLPWSDLDS